MKRLITVYCLLITGLAACAVAPASNPSPVPTMKTSSLPDLGPAPEFVNDVWLNTDAPLRLADLRGKVVAVEMWTFG
ncbi:MAG: hypothetical protein AB1750_20615 [Chloroflexota bacterium]